MLINLTLIPEPPTPIEWDLFMSLNWQKIKARNKFWNSIPEDRSVWFVYILYTCFFYFFTCHFMISIWNVFHFKLTNVNSQLRKNVIFGVRMLVLCILVVNESNVPCFGTLLCVSYPHRDQNVWLYFCSVKLNKVCILESSVWFNNFLSFINPEIFSYFIGYLISFSGLSVSLV